MTHFLSIEPNEFNEVVSGEKTFWLQWDSKGEYNTDDKIVFSEYKIPKDYTKLIKKYHDTHDVTLSEAQAAVRMDCYTGAKCTAAVTFVLRKSKWVIEGVAVMSIRVENVEQ